MMSPVFRSGILHSKEYTRKTARALKDDLLLQNSCISRVKNKALYLNTIK